MIHIHYYIKYCTDHINYYTMLIPPQAPFKIMNEYYCRMMNAQLGAIMQELKQWPPFLLENFMIRLLKNKKSPLFKEILLPGSPVYGRILVWQLCRIGIDKIKSLIRTWVDPF